MRDAQVNKAAVQSMGRRIHEIALMLDELLPTAERTGVKTRSLEAEVLRLADLVRSAHKFCVEYGKRGFISRVARGFWDERTVRQLDTDLSSCVQDIAVTLSAAQLQAFISDGFVSASVVPDLGAGWVAAFAAKCAEFGEVSCGHGPYDYSSDKVQPR